MGFPWRAIYIGLFYPTHVHPCCVLTVTNKQLNKHFTGFICLRFEDITFFSLLRPRMQPVLRKFGVCPTFHVATIRSQTVLRIGCAMERKTAKDFVIPQSRSFKVIYFDLEWHWILDKWGCVLIVVVMQRVLQCWLLICRETSFFLSFFLSFFVSLLCF